MEVILFFFCLFLSGLGQLKRQKGRQAGWSMVRVRRFGGRRGSAVLVLRSFVLCPGAPRAGWLELSSEALRLVRQRGRRGPVLRRAVGFEFWFFEAKGSQPLFSFLSFSSFSFVGEMGGREGRGKGKSGEKQDWGTGRQQAQARTEDTRSGQNETCRALRAVSSAAERGERRAAMPQNGWAAWQARMENAVARLMAAGAGQQQAPMAVPVSTWNIPLRNCPSCCRLSHAIHGCHAMDGCHACTSFSPALHVPA